jgi:magnesium transporter
MIEIYKRTIKNEPLKKLEEYKKDSWINVTDPTKEEIEEIIKKFNLDKDKVVDGLDINETPRIEFEPEGIYIFLRIPTKKISDQATSSFLIVVTKNDFITISRNNLEIFKLISSEKITFYTNQPARNLMKLLYLISREFDISVRRIYKEIKQERKNLNNLTNKDLIELVYTEDILNDYNYSFRPLVDIYEKVLKIKSLKFSEKDKEFIENLIIDLNQTMNINLLTLKTISNMRNYYSTSVSSRLNDIITVLTVFTIFLTIPTLLASIYGMNVELPFQHNNNVLFMLLGVLIFLWVIFLGVIKFKKII